MVIISDQYKILKERLQLRIKQLKETSLENIVKIRNEKAKVSTNA